MKLFLRIGLLLLLAITVVHAQTCSNFIVQGRTSLTASNLVLANAQFAAAVSTCPDDATANALYAISRIAVLPGTPAISNFLTRAGVPLQGRTIYHWTAEPPRDTNGALLAPAGVNAKEFAAVLRTNLLPVLLAAEANLAKVTQTNFLLSLSQNETKTSDITLDYGDVQVLRAMLRGLEYWSYTVYSWNTDVQLSALRSLYDNGLLSIQRVLQDNPGLLTFSTTGDLLAAQQAFTNAVDRYQSGSSFIRSRPGNLKRLFMYDYSQAGEEERFRKALADLQTSLQVPVILSTSTNYTVNLAKHFDGLHPLRSLLPSFSGNKMLAGSLPDATFGGVISQGLTQGAAELFFSRFLKLGAFMTNPRVVGNQVAFDFNTVPGQAYGLEFSYDLRDWYPLYEFSAATNSWQFVEDRDLSGAHFYRLTQLGKYITIQGRVLDACSLAPLAGAVVRTTLDFANAVAGPDGGFRLETQTHEGAPVTFNVTADAPGYQTASISIFESISLKRDLFPQPASLSAPANDSFSNRVALSGHPVTSLRSGCGSTVQADEPGSPTGGTAWWSWTSTYSGLVKISATGISDGQYWVRVFTGSSVTNLVLLTNDLSAVTFAASSGQTYQISVENIVGVESAITLSIAVPPVLNVSSPADDAIFAAPADINFLTTASAPGTSIRDVRFFLEDKLVGIVTSAPYNFQWLGTKPGEYFFTIVATDNRGISTTNTRSVEVHPPNDNFANRTILTGSNIVVAGNNNFASTENGEPAEGDSACCSVWWSWTAPYSGYVTITATGQPPYGENATYLAIYTGSSLASLAPLANGSVQAGDLSTQVSFPVTAGTAYQIAVAGFYNGADLTLRIQPTAAPLVSIVSPPTGTAFAGPTDITLTADASDPDGTIQEVDFFANDQLIGTAVGAPYTILWTNVVAGYYSVQAKAIDNSGVSTRSSVIFIPVAALNDNFDNRIVLSGLNALSYGSNDGTTRENQEPVIRGNTPLQTVWWEWTAPESGMATVRVNGSPNSYPLLGVFTGDFVYALTEVATAASGSAGSYGTCQLTFLATAGTSYKITVASEFFTSFAFSLRVSMP
jgi:hypothetical protein